MTNLLYLLIPLIMYQFCDKQGLKEGLEAMSRYDVKREWNYLSESDRFNYKHQIVLYFLILILVGVLLK